MIKNIIREFIGKNSEMAKATTSLCYIREEMGEFAITADGKGYIVFSNIPKTYTTFNDWLKRTIADHILMAVSESSNKPTMGELSNMVDSLLSMRGVIWDMSDKKLETSSILYAFFVKGFFGFL